MAVISPFERLEEDDDDSAEEGEDVSVEVEPVIRIVCNEDDNRLGGEVADGSNVDVDEEEVCNEMVEEPAFVSGRIMTRR